MKIYAYGDTLTKKVTLLYEKQSQMGINGFYLGEGDINLIVPEKKTVIRRRCTKFNNDLGNISFIPKEAKNIEVTFDMEE